MLRISLLVRLAFVSLFLSAVVLPGLARAQEATPAASPALSPLLQHMVDAINSGDGAAVAALYVEDGVHEDIPAGTLARGREEIAAFVDEAMGLFSDLRFEPVSGSHVGDLAVIEYDFSVTDVASGQPITYRGVIVLELDGNLIRRSADYYDLATVLGQLGLLDLGEAAASGTPAP
jgi:steroid delta-isomerase-like uncharacterized protein